MASGYTQSSQGLVIEKDTEARLFYTFDWSEWLPANDTLATVVYSIAARANDPDPLEIESDGIVGTKTYVELSNGQEGKSYVVTAQITTGQGLIDRRFFRVKVLARSA